MSWAYTLVRTARLDGIETEAWLVDVVAPNGSYTFDHIAENAALEPARRRRLAPPPEPAIVRRKMLCNSV